jgi:hypothetical protein
MKILLSKILFIVCFCLLTQFVVAQETENDTINEVKKRKIFPIYMSINGGISTANCNNGAFGTFCDIYNLVNGSIGYRINSKNAIGIAQSNFLIDNEIKGLVGLEYRYTPVRRGIFSVELGIISNVVFGPTGGNSFQYEYLPDQSQRFYFRLSAGYRFWRIFSLNLNFLQSGESVFMQKKWMELSPVDKGYKNVGIVKNTNELFIWSLGLNLPMYAKE